MLTAFRTLAAALVIGFVHWPACADETLDARRFFETNVQPLLVGHCLECHGKERKGGLDLRTRETARKGGETGAAIEPGSPEASLLYEYVSTHEMPPKKPLQDDQVAVLKKWIADGAFFPQEPLDPFSVSTDNRAGYDWWSLQPLREIKPPTAEGLPAAWNNNPIDRFVFAALQANKLTPSAFADPRTLIRRATYDLTGLPPSSEEVRDFLARCRLETGQDNAVGEKAYAALIDRLLSSPHYGEHWGRHWLDIVRFGESRGFERNEIIRNIWPFRDYIIRSLNGDAPFDRLITEHLAGDVLGQGDPAVDVGTAFLVCGPYDDVGNQDAAAQKQIRANELDEIIRSTSEAFLGLTAGCARCHDHKFDPISQRDYYSLYATFAGVHHGSRRVGTTEQREQYAAQRKALEDKAAGIYSEIEQLRKRTIDRGVARAAEYEEKWTRPKPSREGNEERFAPVAARFVRLNVESTDENPLSNTFYYIDEFEIWTTGNRSRNVALAIHGSQAEGAAHVAQDVEGAYGAQLTIDGKYADRWRAAGPRLTITLANSETIDRVVFSSDRTGLTQQLPNAIVPCEYTIEVSSDGEQWKEVANSYDRRPINASHRKVRFYRGEITGDEQQQLADLQRQHKAAKRASETLPPLPTWWLGDFKEAPPKTRVFLGGSPQREGDQVVPASLSALSRHAPGFSLAATTPEAQRRLALAKWIVADDNPVTARVLVNRLWHYHFGTGIVATPSDFGFMGDRPSHPELLDWLAGQLHQHGWRLKPLHRIIMLSQTYRQSSESRADAMKIDAGSRLMWRFPPRRLTSDEIRDTILQVAGKLDTRMGGPGFQLYKYMQDNVATYEPLDRYGPETYRRSVYHHNARAMHVDLMSDFDGPDCAFSAPRRTSTTTPLQALTLFNHSFTWDMAKNLAERLRREAGADDQLAQVRRGFVVAFSREPDDDEVATAVRVIQEHGLPTFCRALLNTNELIYLD